MQRRITQFLLTAGISLGTVTGFAQQEPPAPGPPVYDPSRPLPTLLPPDPPYADPEAESESPENAPPAPAQVTPSAQPGAPAPAAPADPSYADPSYAEPSYAGPAAAAPPPAYAEETPAPSKLRLRFPDFSAQVELLNILPYGRLAFELEFKLLDWLTVGAVPLFVVGREPLFIPADIRQDSNGIGPLAGISLGAAAWLGGKAFEGTALRLSFTNYGYSYEGFAREDYESRDVTQGQVLDEASHTERRLRLTAGYSYRFGYFLLTGAAGVEYELNQQRRCMVSLGGNGRPYVPATNGCDDNEFGIQRRVSSTDSFNAYAPGGPLYPFGIVASVSVGIVVAK
jgi:hypothetical protein